jgi:hypothetical protein
VFHADDLGNFVARIVNVVLKKAPASVAFAKEKEGNDCCEETYCLWLTFPPHRRGGNNHVGATRTSCVGGGG